MIFLNKYTSFIENKTFKMIVEEEQIYIDHFQKIHQLEENHIILATPHKTIHIHGLNLKVKKLVDQEILLTGRIDTVEVHHDKTS